jgi:TetR/AcrR family transcriptional repressor of nem operon
MRRDGEATREKIMDVAQDLVLNYGYGGTSVDRIIEGAGVTKGAFFYHFKSKNDLARALIDRFWQLDQQQYYSARERAEQLSRDPLQQMLIFVGLFIEIMEPLEEPYPGCLYASYCYEGRILDEETLGVVREAMLFWRGKLSESFETIAAKYPPRLPVDANSLADELTVILEGAFIVSRTLNEPKVTAEQLRHYRSYLELLFSPDI